MVASHIRALGLNIRRLRKARRYTQEALAERAGIDWRHFQDIECGKVAAGFDILYKICRALDCDWNTLMEGIQQQDPRWAPLRTVQAGA